MNPFQQQFQAQTSHPPQMSTYSAATSPPPRIHVSMAERQVQINQSPLAMHAPPLPSPPSLAQQEKANYYARSQLQTSPPKVTVGGGTLPSYHGSNGTKKGAIPSPILPPPRAAFASSGDSPLQSPISWKQAQEFGDVGSIRSGSHGLRVGEGGGGANTENTDWSRYSVLVKESEKKLTARSGKSEWLERRQGKAKRWYWLGWSCSVLLVVAIIMGVVLGIKNHKGDGGDGAPIVPNLGVFNSKEVHTASSTPASAISTVSYASSASSSVSSAATTTSSRSTATTALLQEDEALEVTSVGTTTTQARIETTASPRRQAQTSNTTPSTTATTTSRPTTSSASTSTISRSASTTSSGTAAHRRRFLSHASFGTLKASFLNEPFGRVKREVLSRDEKSDTKAEM